jgi:hypothetical protein
MLDDLLRCILEQSALNNSKALLEQSALYTSHCLHLTATASAPVCAPVFSATVCPCDDCPCMPLYAPVSTAPLCPCSYCPCVPLCVPEPTATVCAPALTAPLYLLHPSVPLCSRKLLMNSRDLLATGAPTAGAFLMIGFSAFLDFTMFVSITGGAGHSPGCARLYVAAV